MSYYFCIMSTRDQPLFELEFGTSKQGGDGIARFSQEARNMNPYLIHGSLDFVDEYQWTNNQMYLRRVDSFSSAHISAFLTPTSTRFMLLHLPHPPNQAPLPNTSPHAFQPFQPFSSTPASGATGGGSAGTGSAGGHSTSSSVSASSAGGASSVSSAPTAASSTSSTRFSSSGLTSSPSSSALGAGTGGIPNNPTSPQTEEAIRQFFGEVFETWIKAIMNPFQHVEATSFKSPVFRERVRLAGKKYL